MVYLDELPKEILELIAYTRPDVGRILALCISSFAEYLRRRYRLPDDIFCWYQRILWLKCPINHDCNIRISTLIYPISATKSIDHDPRLLLARYPSPPCGIAKRSNLRFLTGYLVHSFSDQPAILHTIIHAETISMTYDCYYEKGSIISSMNLDRRRIFKVYRYSKEFELVPAKDKSPIIYRIDCSKQRNCLFFNLALLPWIYYKPTTQSISSFAKYKKWQHMQIDLPEKTWVKLGLVHREDGPAVISHNGNQINYHISDKQSRCSIM